MLTIKMDDNERWTTTKACNLKSILWRQTALTTQAVNRPDNQLLADIRWENRKQNRVSRLPAVFTASPYA
jgi:hypothetical protein